MSSRRPTSAPTGAGVGQLLGGMLSFSPVDLLKAHENSLRKAASVGADGDDTLPPSAPGPSESADPTEPAAKKPALDPIEKARAALIKAEEAVPKKIADVSKAQDEYDRLVILEDRRASREQEANVTVRNYEWNAQAQPEPRALDEAELKKKIRDARKANDSELLAYEAAKSDVARYQNLPENKQRALNKLDEANSALEKAQRLVVTRRQQIEEAQAKVEEKGQAAAKKEQDAEQKRLEKERKEREKEQNAELGKEQKIKNSAKDYFMRHKSAESKAGSTGGSAYGVYYGRTASNIGNAQAAVTLFEKWWTERNGANQEWFTRREAIREPTESAIRSYSAGVSRAEAVKALLEEKNADGLAKYTADDLKDTRPVLSKEEKKAAADAAKEAKKAARAAKKAAPVSVDPNAEGGEEDEEGEEGGDAGVGPDLEVVVNKRIELSAARPVPDATALETLYAEEINRLMAIDAVRAELVPTAAFPTFSNDPPGQDVHWYANTFSDANADKKARVDDKEIQMIMQQLDRPKGSLADLNRAERKNVTDPWGRAKNVRSNTVHTRRQQVVEGVVNARLDYLKKRQDDRKKKADATQKQEQRLAAKTARQKGNKVDQRRFAANMLKGEKDPGKRQDLQNQIDTLDDEIEVLLAAEKKALESAEYHLALAKETEREEKLTATLAELQKNISDEAIEVAAASLLLDRTRKKLQNDYDKSRKELTEEDLNLLPVQPIDRRTRQDGAGEGGGKADDEWEIAGTLFSWDQHDKLFLSEAAKAFQEAKWKAFDEAQAGAPDDEESEAKPMDMSSMAVGPRHFDGMLESTHPLNMVRGGVEIGGKAGAQPEAEDTLGEKALTSGEPLGAKELAKAPVLIFNTPYARHLLRAHLLSLKRMHDRASDAENNPRAKFANVAESCGLFQGEGDDLNVVVEKLLPIFESMLRYRNMMLGAKRMMVADDALLVKGLEKMGIDKIRAHEEKVRRIESTKSRLVALGTLKGAWVVDARRMLTADAGRVPGQLYSPQPYILPLRIAAPPRVGKSATALLVASLAKRIGMVTCYSVAPNKTVPMMELQKKLQRIGWRNFHSGARDGKYTVTAANGGVYDAAVQAESMFTDDVIVREKECSNMRYAAFPVDDIPAAFRDEPYRYGSSHQRLETFIDMVMYSAQTLEDPMRMGAMLSKWSRTDVVVFHIRDEAQVIAKAEKNPVVASHKLEVPPPPELQYLRAYFGNRYGLNCNVTATHFPTLLEENLWGYFGSVRQNIRAGMRADIGFSAIQKKPGVKFLPLLVPALRPYTPPGYVGVFRMKTWIPKDQVNGMPRYLEIAGANYRASRKAKEGGELFAYEKFLKQKDPMPDAAELASYKTMSNNDLNKLFNDLFDDVNNQNQALDAGVLEGAKARLKAVEAERANRASAPMSVSTTATSSSVADVVLGGRRLDTTPIGAPATRQTRKSTRDSRPPPKYGADDKRDDKEKAVDTAKAQAAAKTLTRAEVMLGRKLADRVSDATKVRDSTRRSTRSSTGVSKQPAAAGQDEPKRKGKVAQTVADVDKKDKKKKKAGSPSVSPDKDDPNAPPDTTYSQSGSEKSSSSDDESEDDEDANVALRDLATIDMHFKEWLDAPTMKTIPPAEPLDPDDKEPQTLVPMYIGALNNNIGDDGMISFVRLFTELAHQRYLANLANRRTKGQPGAAEDATYGVAFVLFTTALENRKAVEGSGVDLSNPKGEPLKFRPEPPKPRLRGSKEPRLPASEYKPCEITFADKVPKQNRAAICFVYRPTENATVTLAENEVDNPLRVDAFFTSSAADAIEYLDSLGSAPAPERKGIVDKVAVLGYGMLTAGLTVQTYIKPKRKMFCTQFMALASTDQAALDGQLQIAGRSFVDLKAQQAPKEWMIQLLGVEGKLSKLQNYTLMEERLASVGDDGNQKPMFEVLKRGFKTKFIDLDSFSSLGYIGVRRGEFSNILGLTPESARELVQDVQKAKAGAKSEKDADAALANTLADKDPPPAPDPSSSNSGA